MLADAYYQSRSCEGRYLGQYLAAISDYDKAIQLEPDDAEAYYNRGHCEGRVGTILAAISDYDKAIQLEPDLAEAYNNRGAAKRTSVNTLLR